MEIRLLETAKEDLREGWNFYDRQSTGLGDYFLDNIQNDIQSLMSYAGIHSISNGFYRMLAKRFPFAVYYLLKNDMIEIYAILDCRRDPEWIVKRLDLSHKDNK